MILVYHNINYISKEENTVSLIVFIKHILYLIAFKKQFVYLSEYSNNTNQVVITFDDGHKNIRKYVSPILKMLNIPYEVFICNDFVSCNNKNFMNIDDLLYLEKNGARLEYHTKSHLKLYEIFDEEIIKNEVVCPENFKNLFKSEFLYFAYPYWQFNDVILKIVKNFYKGARSGNGFALNDSNFQFAMDSIKVTNRTNFKELFNA